MMIDSIITKLHSAGFSVSFDDQDILLDNPSVQAVLDDELKETIQVNKQELLFHLRSREYSRLTEQAEKLDAYLNGPSTPRSEREARLEEYEHLVKRISELQSYIDHYQGSGLGSWYESGWMLLHSEILNELIVVVRDETIKVPEGTQHFPKYLLKEINKLKHLDEQQIKQAHSVKKVFQGNIE